MGKGVVFSPSNWNSMFAMKDKFDCKSAKEEATERI